MINSLSYLVNIINSINLRMKFWRAWLLYGNTCSWILSDMDLPWPITQCFMFQYLQHLSRNYNLWKWRETIVLLHDVFHIGLVIGPRPAVMAWGAIVEMSRGFRSSCYWTDWNWANTENIRIGLVFAVIKKKY